VDEERLRRLEETTRYDPREVEQRILEGWLAAGHFRPDPERANAESFSIAIPPPNVTGSLHMGHALNGAIQDALTRKRRMEGRNVLWALGTDHAGIGTQAVVERRLQDEGTSRQELGRGEFIERVWEWREEYGSQIVEQYKRLGASCDYDAERFTLDERYVEAVYRVFVELYERGYIYRDTYMVNWDPGLHSAISDLEVENREVTDTLYSIDYPMEGSEGPEEVITVATVRPETMLADTAVAVNPDDSRYRHVVGRHAIVPLVGRRIPVIADEHVDPGFGTGALKITPGHDPNDFEIGRTHGLVEVTVIGEDGRMTAEAGEPFTGLPTNEAQVAVVEALREAGRLRGEEPYSHSVPFSHRSGERIEPLISLQWFCRMDELARPAIDVVRSDAVRIVPERWKRVYLDWMDGIRPWCVSRQLWWGHRLPVWYCDACEKEIVAVSEPAGCPDCGGELRRDDDVLDTWFSSALWPFAVLGWPGDTPELRAFYPTSVLSTARDILYLWVARMIMMGIEFAGDIPFRDVYVHSVIQAPDGRRMSKSLGTGIDPLEAIDAHGADALRFGLMAMSSSQDVRYSIAKVEQGEDLANKLWNASRLILLNAGESRPAASAKCLEDRWILSRLTRAVGSISEAIDAYDFSHAALELYRFFWSEFCDWYLEIVKPRLYDGDDDAGGNLLYGLERVLGLAHPVMPFVTEEIWGYLPDRGSQLVVQPYPEGDERLVDPEAEAELEEAIELTRALRRWRELAGVAAAAVLPVRLVEGDRPHELVSRLARVSLDGADGGDRVARVGPLEVVASEYADAEQVAARLAARRKELGSEIARAEGKLANEGFVAKAPPEVVEAEREKLAEYRAELEELED